MRTVIHTVAGIIRHNIMWKVRCWTWVCYSRSVHELFFPRFCRCNYSFRFLRSQRCFISEGSFWWSAVIQRNWFSIFILGFLVRWVKFPSQFCQFNCVLGLFITLLLRLPLLLFQCLFRNLGRYGQRWLRINASLQTYYPLIFVGAGRLVCRHPVR